MQTSTDQVGDLTLEDVASEEGSLDLSGDDGSPLDFNDKAPGIPRDGFYEDLERHVDDIMEEDEIQMLYWDEETPDEYVEDLV